MSQEVWNVVAVVTIIVVVVLVLRWRIGRSVRWRRRREPFTQERALWQLVGVVSPRRRRWHSYEKDSRTGALDGTPFDPAFRAASVAVLDDDRYPVDVECPVCGFVAQGCGPGRCED